MAVSLRPWVATSSWVGAVPPRSLKVTLALILGCISQRYSYVPGLRGSEADAVEFFNSPLWSWICGKCPAPASAEEGV